ncbi:MAG: M42 family metallopeptidase [Candidatus Pelethousia sp.]|nr:M42 family metallopeptidase [Candidatus Pelethousia sp.]
MLETALQALTAAYGPSGREAGVRETIAALAAPLCKTLHTDALGNLIAFRPGCSGKKLMLTAHMDQIGLMVTDVQENGFLRVAAVGGLRPAIAIARRVVFENGAKGTVFYETKKKKPGEAQMEELFIDMGAKDKNQAETMARVGDMAVFYSPLEVENGLAVGGALDDRLGCAAVLAALEAPSEHDVYAVFTVQEEVGTRGAGAAAYGIAPDLSVALDVTPAGDTPKAARSPIALGKGPALKIMDGSVVVASQVRRLLAERAEAAGLSIQHEVLTAGGTDTGAIVRTGAGMAAGCISIPCRYIHTPVETAALSDAQGAVTWIKAILEAKL